MSGFKRNGCVDLRALPVVIRRGLAREGADGLAGQMAHSDAAQPSDVPVPTLEVDSALRGRAELETFIHEALHLAFPWMQERPVTQGARYVARILWREGYKLQKQERS